MSSYPMPHTPRRARPPHLARRRLTPWAVTLWALGLAAGVHAQTSTLYSVTALPLSGFTAFNDRGQILGRAFVPCSGLCAQSDSAVLYDTVSGTQVSLTGGFGNSQAFGALGPTGVLVGTRTTYDGTGALVRSVLLRQPDGTLSTLAGPVLPATAAKPLQARGLNAAGQILLAHSDGLDQGVLVSAPPCSDYRAWLGSGATAAGWQALGTADTLVSMAALNANGLAVGAAVPLASCGGPGSGVRAVAAAANGSLLHLHGTLPGGFSRALAVNDLGHAVGEFDSGARTAADAASPQGLPITHAVVWNTASLKPTDLGPAGAGSRLNAVNNRGEVVGRATGPLLAGQPAAGAVSWAVLGNLATAAPLVNLNTLLSQNTSGWVLQEALAINAAGQIVARGATANGVSGYVLLKPLSAPFNPYATVPVAPASLAVSQVSANAARLSWTLSARNATRVVVERCRGGSCTGFAAVATLPGDTLTVADVGLAARTTYRWRVRAGNAAGLSGPSNTAQATTLR